MQNGITPKPKLHQPMVDEMASFRQQVELRLAQLVPKNAAPGLAARHSLLAPGKRLRAVLTMMAAEQCGGSAQTALDVACAVEMIHTASLIFDDLPAMDDAPLRRGQATPHVMYGDGVAILAGIGLLNGGFGVVSSAQELSTEQRLTIINCLTKAVGWEGLVRGQALDLQSEETQNSSVSVEDIHFGKTGALFVAAAVAGGIAAHADDKTIRALKIYGRELGLSYQAFDDLLDHLADDVSAGKPTGNDGEKLTALSNDPIHGCQLENALALAHRHLEAAKSVADFGGSKHPPLIHIADQISMHFNKVFRPKKVSAK